MCGQVRKMDDRATDVTLVREILMWVYWIRETGGEEREKVS
jgi:hypothetical protein